MSLEENILKHKKVLEILSKQPDETNELKAVKKIWNIYEELVKLCDEKNLPNGGHLKRLKYICEQVESAVNFPLYYHKNIIALCGQFSSGKTSMINSFLKNNVLPTSIEPTTALNTYVVYDDQDKDDTLYIRNHFSGRTKIDEDLYDFVTHSFSNEYHQNVRNMVKYVSLHTQKLNFPNIALLDTPGYTGESSDSSLEEDDKNMAIEGIKGADYVIWVIDITNGTIKEDDIRFLEDYAYDKPKLIVLNKADLLPKSRAEEVYNNIKSTLENEGLDDIQIHLYSSIYPEDFPESLNILFKVFKEINDKVRDERIEDIKELFNSFKEYYNSMEKKLASYTEIINISKMNDIFSNALNNSNVNQSLGEIKKERESIKNMTSKLDEFCSNIESLVRKVFPNYDKLKKVKSETVRKNYSEIVRDVNGNFIIRSVMNNNDNIQKKEPLNSFQKNSSVEALRENYSSKIVKDENGNFVIMDINKI